MKRIATVVAALVLAAPALVRAEDAAALFSQKCASCHGKDGKGSPVGKKMGAQDLTAVKAGEAEIEKAITDGKGKMPAYKGKLTPEQIKSLATYVKSGLK